MDQINSQVNGIILGLKTIRALSGVRFVREYSAEPIETPVSGFIASVGVKSEERSSGFIGGDATSSLKGEMYSAAVEIRLYSPNGGNGSGLSELAGEMLTGLRSADTAGIISDASVSSIEFDTELNAIFRRIGFNLEFCLCEEGSS